MAEHEVKTCPKPTPSRRWRNALWICPTCTHAWVLQCGTGVPPREHEQTLLPSPLRYDRPVWSWWPWTPPAGGA